MSTFYDRLLDEKRTLLRIPVHLPATIFIDNTPYRTVTLRDISTGGCSFVVISSERLRQGFVLVFRFGIFGRKLRFTARIAHQEKTRGGIRVGCAFRDIGQAESRALDQYAGRIVDLFFLRRTISMAAFLLSLDALWRIIAFGIYLNYKITPLGASIPLDARSLHYDKLLIVYALCALGAFIFSEKTATDKKKSSLLAVWLLIPAFFFALAKTIAYLWSGMLTSGPLAVTMFVLVECCIVIYAGYAAIVGASSYTKTKRIMDSIENHLEGFLKRGEGTREE